MSADGQMMVDRLRAALARLNALPPAERERRLIAARLRRLLGSDIAARLPHAAANIRAAASRHEGGNVIDFVEHVRKTVKPRKGKLK